MSEPVGPDLSGYSSSQPARRPGPPVDEADRDPVDPPTRPTATQNRNPDDVQLNVRVGREYRDMLDELRAIHPRRRATLRDTLEDLIEQAHRDNRKKLEARRTEDR